MSEFWDYMIGLSQNLLANVIWGLPTFIVTFFGFHHAKKHIKKRRAKKRVNLDR
jgi:hypothetical protein